MLKLISISMLLSFSVGALAQTMSPGIWHAKTSVRLDGIPMPSSEDEKCISKSEAKDVRATIAKQLKEKGCDITSWVVKNKNLNAHLQCKNKDIEATGDITGLVSAKSYHLDGKAKGKFKMLPSTAALKLDGEWVKTCTQ